MDFSGDGSKKMGKIKFMNNRLDLEFSSKIIGLV
jgi:hypothetical protein